MSEEIAQATAARAAELAAIRVRAARPIYEYDDARDGDYIISALIRAQDYPDATLSLDEPSEDECATLRELVQAQADRRALLARLDEATAAADAAIAEYSRYAVELQAARAVVWEAKKSPWITVAMARALTAYDRARPAASSDVTP